MYLLEHADEAARLEEQNSKQLYSVKDELDNIEFGKNDTVLDAGCGTAVISRHISSHHTVHKIYAVDSSEVRIKQAQKITRKEGHSIKFEVGNLVNLPFEDETFDKVLCRFVFHHLIDSEKVIKEFSRVLKKGGKLIIIDSDGILFNLYCKDDYVTGSLEKMKNIFPLDLFVARKLKVLMGTLFSDKNSTIIPMHFTGQALVDETIQYEERFRIMRPLLDEALGVKNADEFVTRYISCLKHEDTELFYNKFTVVGSKK